MIWIAQQRLLFVHNPKCAGTSIHKALIGQYPGASVGWGRRYDAERDEIQDIAHLTAREAREYFDLPLEFRSFGFVRDPYTRFVSAYLHFKRWNPDYESLTPDELAFDILDEARIRSDWKFIHFAPQYRFFYEGRRCVVSRVWKVENMPVAWHQLRSDLHVDADLPELNRLRPVWFEPMSEALIGRINLLYARDFALFGYGMKPGREPRSRHGFYNRYRKLWPELRDLDISDASEV
jgi:hypothetical protein